MHLVTQWQTYTKGLKEGEIGIQGYRISSQASSDGALALSGAITGIEGREFKGGHTSVILGKPLTADKPRLTIEQLQLGVNTAMSGNDAVNDFTNTVASLKRRFALQSSDIDPSDVNFDGIVESWLVTTEHSGGAAPHKVLRGEVYSAKTGEPAADKKMLGEILGRSGMQVITWANDQNPKDHMTPGYSLAHSKIAKLRDQGILKFWEIGHSPLGSTQSLENPSSSGAIGLQRKTLLGSLPDYTPTAQRPSVNAELLQSPTLYGV